MSCMLLKAVFLQKGGLSNGPLNSSSAAEYCNAKNPFTWYKLPLPDRVAQQRSTNARLWVRLSPHARSRCLADYLADLLMKKLI